MVAAVKRARPVLAVTGATGFVGRHLLRLAREAGHPLRALTRGWRPPEEGIDWIDGALDRPDALAKLVDGADAVIHIAGLINAPTRAAFEAVNVGGTANMIDAARAIGVRRFIHISSLAAREPDLSDYGWSKAKSERVVAASGLDWTIVRPPAIYGPGDRETFELFKMARRGFVALPPDDPVPEIRDLLDESLALYPDYCAGLREQTGIDPEFWRCGATMTRANGERWLPELAQVRNPRLLQALIAALRREGVRLIEQAPVLGWQKENGRLTGVLSSQGVIHCKRAVLAAGAWSGGLAAIQVKPVKGQMLLLRGEPGALDHMKIDEAAYLVPRRDGRILVGSTLEDSGFDLGTTAEARSQLMEHAVRLWPQAAHCPVEQQWSGLRPYPGQASPLMGPVPELEGLFVNTGHFRLGVTLSLASARRLTARLLDS